MKDAKKDFFAVQKAYEILSSQELRSEWDALQDAESACNDYYRGRHSPIYKRRASATPNSNDYYGMKSEFYESMHRKPANEYDGSHSKELNSQTTLKLALLIVLLCVLAGEYLNIRIERLRSQMIKLRRAIG